MQHTSVEFHAEADYLSNEAASPVKHEYVAGVVFAMAGTSKRHGTLAGNAFIALHLHMRGKTDAAYYYPDVVATCTPAGWTQDIYQAGETVQLASVGIDIPMAELYADTDI